MCKTLNNSSGTTVAHSHVTLRFKENAGAWRNYQMIYQINLLDCRILHQRMDIFHLRAMQTWRRRLIPNLISVIANMEKL